MVTWGADTLTNGAAATLTYEGWATLTYEGAGTYAGAGAGQASGAGHGCDTYVFQKSGFRFNSSAVYASIRKLGYVWLLSTESV